MGAEELAGAAGVVLRGTLCTAREVFTYCQVYIDFYQLCI
jgi:hypothetical protein